MHVLQEIINHGLVSRTLRLELILKWQYKFDELLLVLIRAYT